mmetsp:Transcript_121043/g.277478  ORF Transcript_121043/g.277478 Transcript_121043/m.277478 type:complete len:237 (+) Transcript_121043:421-1131(+)
MHGHPNFCCIALSCGMVPPSRTSKGSTSQTSVSAAVAAWNSRLDESASHHGKMDFVFTSKVLGDLRLANSNSMCFLMQSAHWASLMSGTVRADTVILTVLLMTRAQFPHSPPSEYCTSVTDRAGSSQVRLKLSSASSPLLVVPNAPRGTPRRAQMPSTVTPCTAFLIAMRSISHMPRAPSVNPGTAMPRKSVRVFPRANKSETGSFSKRPPCNPECRSRSPPVLMLISTSSTPRIP